MNWIRRHAPLVVIAILAVLSTVVAAMVDHALIVSIAGNLWGLVVLLVVYDITPRYAQEKQERA